MSKKSVEFWALLALGGVILYFFAPYLVSLAVGLVFASLLIPLQIRLEAHRWRPHLASALLTLMFMFTVMLPVGGILAVGASHLMGSSENKPAAAEGSQPTGKSGGAGDMSKLAQATQPEKLSQTIVQSAPAQTLLDRMRASQKDAQVWLRQNLQQLRQAVSKALTGLMAQIPDAIFSGMIALATLYFMLAERKRARDYALHTLGLDHRLTDEWTHAFSLSSRSVIMGSALSGACQATVLMTATLILNRGPTALVGLLTFLLSFIPVVGTAPLSFALFLSQAVQGDWPHALGFFIAGFLTSSVDNIVWPWVVGRNAQLHPLLVFVAAFGAVPAIGPWGLFLGPILTYVFLHAVEIRNRPAPTLDPAP